MTRATTGLSGADLANLCNEAALIAARHNHRQVGRADFNEAGAFFVYTRRLDRKRSWEDNMRS